MHAVLDLRLPRELHERLLKAFMDMAILSSLLNDEVLSGYDIITLIHEKHRILLSAGTIYATLYQLERNNLIDGVATERKRVYKLTNKGREVVEDFQNNMQGIQLLIRSLAS